MLNQRRTPSRDRFCQGLVLLPLLAVLLTPVVIFYDHDHEPSRSVSSVILLLSLALFIARIILQFNVILSQLDCGQVIVSELVGGSVMLVALVSCWLTVSQSKILPDLVLSAAFLAMSAAISGLVWGKGNQLHFKHLYPILIEESVGFGIIIWALIASMCANVEYRDGFVTAIVGGSVLRCYAVFAIDAIRTSPWK